MTPNDQRIAIAKAAGWNVHHGGKYCSLRNRAIDDITALPGLFDPLIDLNAMHEAEKWLTWKQRDAYRELLTEAEQGAGWNILHATAAQRAEAFLRTLNLWTES